MVTFALGSCLHFRVVNQAKRGGETRPAAQLQCPTSELKKSLIAQTTSILKVQVNKGKKKKKKAKNLLKWLTGNI